MKKVISFVFVALLTVTLVGCSFTGKDKKESKERTYEYLLDLYARAYNEEKPELIKEVFPEFVFKGMEDQLTVENIKRAKSYYGDNVKFSFEVTGKTKMDDEWIEKANEDLKNYYNTDTKVKECYQLEGTTSIKGSEDESTSNMEELWYCDFDGTWYLIFG